MLSKISQTLRNSFVGDHNNGDLNSRKRTLESDLDEASTSTPSKRCRQDSGSWSALSFKLSSMSTWIKKKSSEHLPQSSSPSTLLKRLFTPERTSPIGLDDNQDNVTSSAPTYTRPPLGGHSVQKQASLGQYSAIGTSQVNPPPPCFVIRNLNPQQFQSVPLADFSFSAGGPRPVRPHSPPPISTFPPMTRTIFPQSTKRFSNSPRRQTNSTMYEKTYMTPKNAGRITKRVVRSRLAVKECIRMEDRDMYARLLQSKGALSPQQIRHKTKLSSMFSCDKKPPIIPDNRVRVSPNQSSNNSCVSSRDSGSFDGDLQRHRIRRPYLKSLFGNKLISNERKKSENLQDKTSSIKDAVVVVDSDSDEGIVATETPSNRLAISSTRSSVDSECSRERKLSLKDSDGESVLITKVEIPSYSKTESYNDWYSGYVNATERVTELQEKYKRSTRKKQRAEKEEQIKKEFFTNEREKFDQLDKKLRLKLSLAAREPTFIEEIFLDEDEEEDEFPELTEEMEDAIDDALQPYPPQQVLSEAFRLQVTRTDIATLNGLNWLNDEVINFYMELLRERSEGEEFPSVHAFNTFFYPKVMSGGQSAVKRWTKRVDILAKDIILVPVHLGMHWCLAVIDVEKKQIRYYDSMGGNNNRCLTALRDYMAAESLQKKNEKLDMSDWELLNVKDIPQQMNGSDCGVFTCKFADYITKRKEITFTQEHMPYFRRRMIYEILEKKLL